MKIQCFTGLTIVRDGRVQHLHFDKDIIVPIYNDPNHLHYGPSRRLHLILLYLFCDELVDVEAAFENKHGYDWTEFMSRRITLGVSEARTAKDLLSHMLEDHYR